MIMRATAKAMMTTSAIETVGAITAAWTPELAVIENINNQHEAMGDILALMSTYGYN
jgi:hypothetical protein